MALNFSNKYSKLVQALVKFIGSGFGATVYVCVTCGELQSVVHDYLSDGSNWREKREGTESVPYTSRSFLYYRDKHAIVFDKENPCCCLSTSDATLYHENKC